MDTDTRSERLFALGARVPAGGRIPVRAIVTAIFRDMAPCSAYVNRRFGGTYRLRLQGRKSVERETSVQRVVRQ
jgi:hypothetical protein